MTTPDVGSGGQVRGALTFPDARYGAGASVTANSTYISIAVTDGAGAALPDFDKARGAVEFWYQPNYASTDDNTRDLAGLYNDVTNEIDFQKLHNASGNNLLFRLRASGVNSDCQVSGATYSWRANDWVHLRFEWDETAPAASQQKVYVNGVLQPCTAAPIDYVAANLNLGLNGEFWVGNIANGAFQPGLGLYDEVHVYGGSSAPFTALANGGLIGSRSEYLADIAANFPLGFAGVDGVGGGDTSTWAPTRSSAVSTSAWPPGAGVAAGDSTGSTGTGRPGRTWSRWAGSPTPRAPSRRTATSTGRRTLRGGRRTR